MKGKFIVIEGLDGCGKGVQIDLIHMYFSNIVVTSEPTNSPIGKLIREYLKNTYTCENNTLALLFAADRNEHVKEIQDFLDKGINVLCDRYIYSNFAYQGEFAKDINRSFLRPDLLIFIDTDPDTCLDRISKRNNGKEIFENKEDLEKIQNEYYAILKNELQVEDIKNYHRVNRNAAIINGNNTVEEVWEDIRGILSNFL